MYPVLFEIGFIKIYSHGLMMALGLVIGGVVLYKLAIKQGLNASITVDLLIYSVLAGLIGARLMYVIFYAGQFSNWKEFLFIWNGGLVSFGGIIAGFLTAWYFLKKKQEKWLSWFDTGFVALMLGWTFGRIGCYLSGDIAGEILNQRFLWWDTWPVALIESAFCLVLFVVLLVILNKKNLLPGRIFFYGLVIYSVLRFILDFARISENTRLWLNMSQWGDLLMIFIALVILIKARQEA